MNPSAIPANVRDELRRMLARRIGPYRRWHKLLQRYRVFTEESVDLDAFVADVSATIRREGRRLFVPAADASAMLSRSDMWSYRDDWVLWDNILRELRMHSHDMDIDHAMRIWVMGNILRNRREGKDVQKEWIPLFGEAGKERDLRRRHRQAGHHPRDVRGRLPHQDDRHPRHKGDWPPVPLPHAQREVQRGREGRREPDARPEGQEIPGGIPMGILTDREDLNIYTDEGLSMAFALCDRDNRFDGHKAMWWNTDTPMPMVSRKTAKRQFKIAVPIVWKLAPREILEEFIDMEVNIWHHYSTIEGYNMKEYLKSEQFVNSLRKVLPPHPVAKESCVLHAKMRMWELFKDRPRKSSNIVVAWRSEPADLVFSPIVTTNRYGRVIWLDPVLIDAPQEMLDWIVFHEVSVILSMSYVTSRPRGQKMLYFERRFPNHEEIQVAMDAAGYNFEYDTRFMEIRPRSRRNQDIQERLDALDEEVGSVTLSDENGPEDWGVQYVDWDDRELDGE